MKIYRVRLSAKLVLIIFSLLIIVISVAIIFDNKASIILKAMIPFVFLLAIGGISAIINFKFIIDEEKVSLSNIDIFALFKGQKVTGVTFSLNWDEIEELQTTYVLFPENPIIILKPRHGSTKKSIEFMPFGISLDLLRDILTRLPPNTKVYLYPYIKRKIEHKQTFFYT